MEEATFLTRFARSVTLVHHRDGIMLDRAPATTGYGSLTNHRSRGEDRGTPVTSLQVRDITPVPETTLPVTVFSSRHYERSRAWRTDTRHPTDGYVLECRAYLAPSLPSVFAAGDLVDRAYRQAVVCSRAVAAPHGYRPPNAGSPNTRQAASRYRPILWGRNDIREESATIKDFPAPHPCHRRYIAVSNRSLCCG